MKSIIQKGIIPARTQSQDKKFQTSDHVKYEGQVRSGQVRSGQVRSQHLLFVQFSP